MFLSRSVKTRGRADIADWWGVTGARPLPHQSQSWTHFLRRVFLASHILGYNRGAVPGEVQTRNYISVQEASCPPTQRRGSGAGWGPRHHAGRGGPGSPAGTVGQACLTVTTADRCDCHHLSPYAELRGQAVTGAGGRVSCSPAPPGRPQLRAAQTPAHMGCSSATARPDSQN